MTEAQWDPVTGAPGDFQRHPVTGAPYVNHPTKCTTNGRPSRVMYGRPSNFGSQIEDRYGLTKWTERTVLLGAAQLAQPVLAAISGLDPDDETERKLLDGYVIDAKDGADGYLAARRGTNVHLLTHHLDNGEVCPVTVLAEGERLGLEPVVCDALMRCWADLLERNGLEVLAVEQTVVDDQWRLAGTLDRIVRCTRPLVFGGVLVPAGTVCVLDVKTGRLRLDGAGHPQFWHSYSVQLASYAHSVPYRIDTLIEHREEWPWPVSQRHALIGHLDVANAIEERVAVGSLWHVDVVAGLSAGNLARAARDWQSSNGLFTEHDADPVCTSVRNR